MSEAKLNAFKSSSWPLDLLGLQTADLKIRTRILKLIKHVLQYLELKHLLSISEFIHDKLTEAFTTDPKVIIESMDIIKYMNILCSFTFKLLNLVPIEKHNFALFSSFINLFY
jgi:hypothetical protein